MKKSLFLFFFCAQLLTAYGQANYQPTPENLKARETFQDRKYGLFIHWGIYSLLGDGEWVMHQKKIPYASYSRLASAFYPHQFNANEWVQLAKAAGMKYITVTSRHHDGFSMFQTKASPYNIVDATPFHRDPLRELAEACQREGITLNFYYSLLDWGRPDYGFGQKITDGKPETADWASYVRFMKTQLTELLTQYPAIGAIWFDGHWERKDVNWHYDEIYSLIHGVRSDILVGNNHHLKPFSGEDYQLFEKDLPGQNHTGFSGESQIGNLPLETCETINGAWGYNINDRKYKTPKQLVHYLVNAAGRNANFLLNVGPMPNGQIQPEFMDTLKVVGKWLSTHGESIYGTRGGLVPPQEWGVSTRIGAERHFLHVLKKPTTNVLFVPGFTPKVATITSMETKQALKYKQQPEGLLVYLDPIPDEAWDHILEIRTK